MTGLIVNIGLKEGSRLQTSVALLNLSQTVRSALGHLVEASACSAGKVRGKTRALSRDTWRVPCFGQCQALHCIALQVLCFEQCQALQVPCFGQCQALHCKCHALHSAKHCNARNATAKCSMAMRKRIALQCVAISALNCQTIA